LLGAALRSRTATELLALVTGADLDGEALLVGDPEEDALSRSLQPAPRRATDDADRWERRVHHAAPPSQLALTERARGSCPGLASQGAS
jgi:hypothetical protein